MLEATAAFLTSLDGRVAAAAAVIAVVAAGSFLGVHSSRDRLYQEAHPTAVKLVLPAGAADVRPDQRLTFRSPRALSLASFRSAFHLTPAARGDLARSQDGRTFTWQPAPGLAEVTQYTVRVDSIRDAGGHRLEGGTWRFRTAAVPRVLGLSLDSGAPLPEGDQVPVGAGLQLSFSQPMNPATVKLLANGSPLPLAWAADRKSAGVNTGSLKPGPLELQLGPGGRDQAGRAAAQWTLQAAVVFHAGAQTVPLRAPALVQIANDALARDQAGLQAANAVYEYQTEGGITRLTALFSSAPDLVGPIHSGRLISLKLARHYRGMLFMSDLSRGSAARLNAEPVPTVLDASGVFFRSGERPPPDNLLVSGASMEQAEERQAIQPAALKLGGALVPAGDPATEVSVAEHGSSYSYDPASATYLKTEGGHRFLDAALGGQPVRINLLIVLHTTANQTGYAEDSLGHPALDYDLDSGGRADFYYGGLHATGRWTAPEHAGPLHFTLESGLELDLPSGLTWIDVVTG